MTSKEFWASEGNTMIGVLIDTSNFMRSISEARCTAATVAASYKPFNLASFIMKKYASWSVCSR